MNVIHHATQLTPDDSAPRNTKNLLDGFRDHKYNLRTLVVYVAINSTRDLEFAVCSMVSRLTETSCPIVDAIPSVVARAQCTRVHDLQL